MKVKFNFKQGYIGIFNIKIIFRIYNVYNKICNLCYRVKYKLELFKAIYLHKYELEIDYSNYTSSDIYFITCIFYISKYNISHKYRIEKNKFFIKDYQKDFESRLKKVYKNYSIFGGDIGLRKTSAQIKEEKKLIDEFLPLHSNTKIEGGGANFVKESLKSIKYY